MAESLVWHLIRDNNSFLVKRGRTNCAGSVQFSSEPGNLLNVNTFKHSGLANNNSIHIPLTGKSSKVVVVKKTGKTLNRPSKTNQSQVVKTAAGAAAATAGYRSDLASAAKERYARVFKDAIRKRGLPAARARKSRGTR